MALLRPWVSAMLGVAPMVSGGTQKQVPRSPLLGLTLKGSPPQLLMEKLVGTMQARLLPVSAVFPMCERPQASRLYVPLFAFLPRWQLIMKAKLVSEKMLQASKSSAVDPSLVPVRQLIRIGACAWRFLLK